MARTGRLEPPWLPLYWALRIYTTTLYPTRTLTWHTCCHSTSPSLHIVLVASFRTRRERGTLPEKDLSMSSLLPSFHHLTLFQTPSTSYYFSRFLLMLGRTSGISRAHSKRVYAKKRSSVYISRSRREREIKAGDFASFRASLLFGPVLFVDRRFCINRNLSPPKTKPPWREESWTEVLCCSRRALSLNSRNRGRGWFPVYFAPPRTGRLFIVDPSRCRRRFDKCWID